MRFHMGITEHDPQEQTKPRRLVDNWTRLPLSSDDGLEKTMYMSTNNTTSWNMHNVPGNPRHSPPACQPSLPQQKPNALWAFSSRSKLRCDRPASSMHSSIISNCSVNFSSIPSAVCREPLLRFIGWWIFPISLAAFLTISWRLLFASNSICKSFFKFTAIPAGAFFLGK